MSSNDLSDRILKISLLVLDVDGVMTDGRIIYGDYGDELKCFDVQDGLGIALLKRVGIPTAIISAKKSKINQRRAKELGVYKLFQKVPDKLKVFERLIKKLRLKPEQACFIADDLVDIPVLSRVGLAVGVKNAVEEVKEIAHYVTLKNGGRGAVREIVDLILKTQGKWEQATERYFK